MTTKKTAITLYSRIFILQIDWEFRGGNLVGTGSEQVDFNHQL